MACRQEHAECQLTLLLLYQVHSRERTKKQLLSLEERWGHEINMMDEVETGDIGKQTAILGMARDPEETAKATVLEIRWAVVLSLRDLYNSLRLSKVLFILHTLIIFPC